jgi:hypothetical protein
MGKLIKNHWGRLIALTAAIYQIAAALEGFFWPKVLFDFLTDSLNGAVIPVNVLAIINLIMGIATVCWEWPLKYVAGTAVHRSIPLRIVVYPLSALPAILMYQSTNPAIYLVIATVVYIWAYSEGEVRIHALRNSAIHILTVP